MIEFIALLFVNLSQDINPIYRYGHCYQSPDAQYRPSIIGIHGVAGNYYKYRVWYGRELGWSTDLLGKVYTIENVYEKEVKCP